MNKDETYEPSEKKREYVKKYLELCREYSMTIGETFTFDGCRIDVVEEDMVFDAYYERDLLNNYEGMRGGF